MTTILQDNVSPVDMESRKSILLRPGDTVRVHQKITEKNRTRIQIFEGIILAVKHGSEPGATFTVRRVGTDGIAIERIYPLYSPMIDCIEVIRRGRVRRARLYFLRDKTPKQVREKLRRTVAVQEKTTVESQRSKEAEVVAESAQEGEKDGGAPESDTTEKAEEKTGNASSSEKAEEKAGNASSAVPVSSEADNATETTGSDQTEGESKEK